ncbi:hypothetical protein LCGC14_1676940 [marine sediment metagenome]|uniref:Exonuclease domain-containing protein n=1 Tax=marine sediment metagenome TaxID=412755 RepID=A0A0F9KPN1_9ZZZZ
MKTNKIEAIKTAREWLKLKPVFLDTETTGLDSQAEIVHIAIIDHDGTELISTLVRPISPIPEQATSIHGIRNEDVILAPAYADIQLNIGSLLYDRLVVIYNKNFDLRLMEQSARANLEFPLTRCAMELYAQFYGDWNERHQSYRWQKQSNAARQLGIETPANLHRAAADANLCRLIIEAMAATPLPDEVQNLDRFGQEICECTLCGQETPMIGTRLCDRCWELKSRIEADPDLARKILMEYNETRPPYKNGKEFQENEND